MRRAIRNLIGIAVVVAIVGACSGPAATTAPTLAAPTLAAATQGAPSSAPATTAAGATVEATAVGSAGTILVAGSNGMTLYNFSKDTKDSGTSACTGGCLETWPALTVAAGESPIGGDGVSGKLGTITRTDDGSLQVTYNGLPLYFFKNDKAPGDLNGVYENWVTVKP
jgi:predicted lipoprotein with Yx(FWY)xxD motif